ncbi:MAG: hypothetical protein ACLTKG_07780, partial [Collinsella intestinalis]
VFLSALAAAFMRPRKSLMQTLLVMRAHHRPCLMMSFIGVTGVIICPDRYNRLDENAMRGS